MRSLLVDALVTAGHAVDTAGDGLTGLAKLEAGHFDVVLVDLALPQGSGLALARSAKRLSPETPVVLITGWGHLLDPERLRPVDVPVVSGDPSVLTRTTGWRPEIALDTTLADTLAYWRDELR